MTHGPRNIHSRSVLAGYDPAVLGAARVLVVGAGALGQNVLQDLALAGVGHLAVVDFDGFEPHNATRSPFYPSPHEQERWGLDKATIVAHRARRISTAAGPTVHHGSGLIQAFGDGPIGWADVVVSAVDNPGARAWLAERCRLRCVPLVEGGFHGPEINLGLFGPDHDEPCFRCLNPVTVGAFSCTRYALEAEAAHVIPAIQNGAAVLGGLVAEQVISWLQGAATLRRRRAYLDVRAATGSVVELMRAASCPGIHLPPPHAMTLPVAADATVAELTRAVRAIVGPADIYLSEPFVFRITCAGCGRLAEPGSLESRWLRDPRCSDCGGGAPLAPEAASPSGLQPLCTEAPDAVWELPTRHVGLAPGAAALIVPFAAPPVLGLMPWTGIGDLLTPVEDSPVPPPDDERHPSARVEATGTGGVPHSDPPTDGGRSDKETSP